MLDILLWLLPLKKPITLNMLGFSVTRVPISLLGNGVDGLGFLLVMNKGKVIGLTILTGDEYT